MNWKFNPFTRRLDYVGSTGGGGGGEANTASNLGAGEGVFAAKVGVDLRFKSLTGASGRVLLSSSPTEIDFDVDEAALDLGNLAGQVAWTSQIDFTGSNLDDLLTRSHADLQNLLADDHTQYLLLAGRAGGQIAHGGSASGNPFTLRSNASQDGIIRLSDDSTKADEAVVVHGTSRDIVVQGTTYHTRLSVREQEGLAYPPFALVKAHSTGAAGNTVPVLRARGTLASPTAVQDNDLLLNIITAGYGDTDYFFNSTIFVRVDDPSPSDTSQGTEIGFTTTPVGSITSAERLRIDNTGRVYVTGSGLSVRGLDYVWPATQAANRVLKTDGSSNLSWGQVAFSELTGTLAHSALSGLTSGDDHTQYALLAGRSGGQTLNGGTAVADHLDLWANANAWAAASAGRIRLHNNVTFPDNWSLTNGDDEYLIDATATYTLPNGATAIVGYRFAPTIAYSAQQTLSQSPAFRAAQTIQPTATLADTLTIWSGMDLVPSYIPTAAGCTSPRLAGCWSRPRSTPGVATAITTVAAYASWIGDVFTQHFNNNVTLDNLIHYECVDPTKSSAPAITDHIGLYVPVLTTGTRISSLVSAGSGVLMRHVGAAKFGGAVTDTPSAQLHVLQPTINSEVTRFESTTSGTPAVVSEVRRQGRVTTTNNTVTTLMSYTLTAGRAYLIEARVVAHRTGGASGAADDSAAYVVYAGAKHTGGAAALITAVGPDYTDEDQAGWNATIDTNGNDVRVRVTGATGNDVTWHCTLVIQEVGS